MASPKVLIGAPCSKVPVFDDFYDAFYQLEMPVGSLKIRARGGNIPVNLNLLVDEATAQGCSHLFIVEDDSSFDPDTLMRLLAWDKPVVAGLCRSRSAPFRPYIYEGYNEQGLGWRPLRPEDQGLIKVTATGMGGILIRMDVFEKLQRPYFQHAFEGEVPWGQDVLFGIALAEAGVEVYCDLSVTIYHATQCVLGSTFVNGAWQIVVSVGGVAITVPEGVTNAPDRI